MTSAPLEGIRVLDFSQLLPGGHAGMVLADFGAQIIKVEPPGTGDPMRLVHPARADGQSGRHLVLNRGKRSLCADLKDEKDHELVRRLAKEADVVIESFRPGVMTRLGFGYEELCADNPGLIYVSLSGFGQAGARSAQPSHDINFLALSGYLDLATRKADTPTLPAIQIGDLGGGALQAVIGTLLALRSREQGGVGQHLDIAMFDGLMSMLASSIADSNFTKSDPKPGGGRLTGELACYRAYRCNDGRHIAVGALEAKFWKQLVIALGRPDLVADHLDPARQQFLGDALNAIFATLTQNEVMDIVGDNVCVTPVRSFEEALQDTDLWNRGALVAGRADGIAVEPGPAPALQCTLTSRPAEPLDSARTLIEAHGWL